MRLRARRVYAHADSDQLLQDGVASENKIVLEVPSQQKEEFSNGHVYGELPICRTAELTVGLAMLVDGDVSSIGRASAAVPESEHVGADSFGGAHELLVW